MKKKTALISGCFDGCHEGHKYILQKMRELVGAGGDVIVCLNNDDYIRRKKNREPLFDYFDRRKDLQNTGLVDFVYVIYCNPIDIIMEFEPDYICVGSDYTPEQVVGYEECKEWGGQIIIIDRLPGISTTKLIERINDALRKI